MALDLVALRQSFHARRHTALLVAIIVAFAVRPLIGTSGAGAVVLSFALLALLLVALLTIEVDDLVGERDRLLAQKRRRRIMGWVLAVFALVDRIFALLIPSRGAFVLGSIVWFVFFVFVTWCQLGSVLRQKTVTSETISNSVSVYLLLGLCWAFLYIVLTEIDAGSFNFGATPPATQEHLFPVLVYFSLTTLSTTGFGDILPLTLQARYAAVAEGITGQFYLAILVARLVSLQMKSE